MVEQFMKIRINSTEENKEFGFFTLMNSGTSVICLKNDEYIVNGIAIDSLNKKGVHYNLILNNMVSCDKKEVKENAPSVKS